MRWARAVVPAVALMVLSGCSGDGEEGAAEPASSTTPPPAAGCPPVPLPTAATDSTIVGGDFDGDGRPDRFQTYRTATAGPWRVRVDLAAGGATETELPATAEAVRALGGARLDTGASETALAVVGSDEAGADVGLFVVRSCRLERVTVAGAPARFPVRTSGGARAGLACQPPGLVAYQATTTDGRFFQASSVAYLLVGGALDEANRSTSTIGADDAVFPRYGAFSCAGLRL